MSVRYYVGDEAPSPLAVNVKRSDGSPFDLTPYEEVTVEGDGLPDGATTVLDAPAGRVQRTFDEGFAEAGNLQIRLKLLDAGGTVDYTDPMTLPVHDPGPDEAMPQLVTTDQVEAITGVLVSSDDIIQAQNVIALAVGIDLSDPDWVATLSAADQYWLALAVAYQSTTTAGGDDAASAASAPFGLAPIPGVASVKAGDVQVVYDKSGTSQGATAALLSSLHPNAQLAIRRLSWLGAVRTLHATPFLAGRVEPSRWVPLYSAPAAVLAARR